MNRIGNKSKQVMKRIRKLLCLCVLIPLLGSAQDLRLNVLRDELKRQMTELSQLEEKPYYINFRVEENTAYSVSARFGALLSSNSERSSVFMPQIRLGSVDLDSHMSGQAQGGRRGNESPQQVAMPLEVDMSEAAMRQAIWREVNTRYKASLRSLESERARSGVAARGQDNAPNFTPITPEKFFEPDFTPEQRKFDAAYWEARVREYSAIPMREQSIIQASASISFNLNRRYFVDTDGSEIAQNHTYCRLMVQATTMADDGMELPLNVSYFAFKPEDLPKPEKVKADVEALTDKLIELRKAPLVQPYTGPALLSGDASGVFFHEIFGHRIEGQMMKNTTDGQTFKKLVGEYVLPESMSVFDDPTLKTYNGWDLNGYFQYDEQGVKGERVNVVVDGILRDFLMTRTAIEGFEKTNGHGRAQMGYEPVSRQSNLVIETSDPKTEAALRELLVEEIKSQGKEYGFLFRQVTGGFTMTSATSTNSFQVTPLEVYRVYPDNRPDELVRGVDLIGTPLSMFSNIQYAGGETKMFIGTCGAASGNIPVTAISPMIMVNKIEVQRKPSPRVLPHILPRP